MYVKEFFMFNDEVFANRFKLLRISHELSVSQLAELLSLKSKGSISAFEAQRGFPSYEILIRISSLFAISLDWLTGRSDTPYLDEIIAKQEAAILNPHEHPSIVKYPDLGYFYRALYEIQQNPTYRHATTRSHFPLPVRANILFALTVLKYASQKLYSEQYNSQKISLDELLYKLFDNKNKTSKQLAILYQKCLDALSVYKNERYFNNPIFDISKQSV